jgi:hypothetical protein
MIMMCRAAPDGRFSGVVTALGPVLETLLVDAPVEDVVVVVCAVAGAGDDVGASTV